MSSPIDELHQLGQSLWYDNIERRILRDGKLKKMILEGKIRGVTSNPSIFEKAIAGSNDYDDQLAQLVSQGWSAVELYEKMAIADIQAAADLFRPLYEDSAGGDGFVSLEVNPRLARDTDATVEEARRLWAEVDRPNLMVKIPATKEGLPAIRESIASGLNINVTLIFSLNRYEKVIDAYFSGLEDRLGEDHAIENIASVASFFVSRVDSKIDKRLVDLIRAEGPHAGVANQLLGTIAVANAKLAYAIYQQQHNSPRFVAISDQGGQRQRPLWASTSTKNPDYSDVKYVEELIGPETVNTVPQSTLEAFEDHGSAELTIESSVELARRQIVSLGEVGLSIDQATAELEVEGVQAFADSFEQLLATIEDRRSSMVS